MATYPEVKIHIAVHSKNDITTYGALLTFSRGKPRYLQGVVNGGVQRAELTGIAKALEMLSKKHLVYLYTETDFLERAIEEKWLYIWEKRDYIKKDGTKVKNSDIIKDITNLIKNHLLEIKQGNPKMTGQKSAKELAIREYNLELLRQASKKG